MASKYDNVSSDFIEIIAGTNNTISKPYLEAKKEVESGSDKSMTQLKNFYADIEKTYKQIGNKKNDKKFAESKGDITKFAGYADMKYAIDLLNKHLKSNAMMKNLITVKDALDRNKSIYIEAYDKNIRLVMHEYENTLYILQMGICMLFADCVEITKEAPGYKINVKGSSDNKFVDNVLSKLASNIKDNSHKKYLDSIMEAARKSPARKSSAKTESYNEEVFTEDYDDSVFDDRSRALMNRFPYLGAFTSILDSLGTMFTGLKSIYLSIKRSLFGIIPLIRSIIYLRYKRKADTILALEMNIALIKENIEILKRVKNRSDAEKKEIIKKQEAVCESYQKRIAKLKAELGETAYEASKALKQKEPDLKKTDSSKGGDDDFVLEGVDMTTLYNTIGEQNKVITD